MAEAVVLDLREGSQRALPIEQGSVKVKEDRIKAHVMWRFRGFDPALNDLC